MPRVRSSAPPLSNAVKRFLLTGAYGQRDEEGRWVDTFLLAGQFLHRVGRPDAVTPEVWITWRDALVDEHIETAPGSRPFSWWCWDAPAPRHCGGLAPELHRPAWLWRPQRGVPFEEYRLPSGTVLVLESEPHYLDRYGLLEPAERKRLTAVDFEPETIAIEED